MRRTKRVGKLFERAVLRERGLEEERKMREQELMELERRLSSVMSKEDFLRHLSTSYRTLKYVEKVEEPIPIPKLRKDVCRRAGIDAETFDSFLNLLSVDDRISLIPPERKDVGGIKIGDRYYQFLKLREA